MTKSYPDDIASHEVSVPSVAFPGRGDRIRSRTARRECSAEVNLWAGMNVRYSVCGGETFPHGEIVATASVEGGTPVVESGLSQRIARAQSLCGTLEIYSRLLVTRKKTPRGSKLRRSRKTRELLVLCTGAAQQQGGDGNQQPPIPHACFKLGDTHGQ